MGDTTKGDMEIPKIEIKQLKQYLTCVGRNCKTDIETVENVEYHLLPCLHALCRDCFEWDKEGACCTCSYSKATPEKEFIRCYFFDKAFELYKQSRRQASVSKKTPPRNKARKTSQSDGSTLFLSDIGSLKLSIDRCSKCPRDASEKTTVYCSYDAAECRGIIYCADHLKEHQLCDHGASSDNQEATSRFDAIKHYYKKSLLAVENAKTDIVSISVSGDKGQSETNTFDLLRVFLEKEKYEDRHPELRSLTQEMIQEVVSVQSVIGFLKYMTKSDEAKLKYIEHIEASCEGRRSRNVSEDRAISFEEKSLDDYQTIGADDTLDPESTAKDAEILVNKPGIQTKGKTGKAKLSEHDANVRADTAKAVHSRKTGEKETEDIKSKEQDTQKNADDSENLISARKTKKDGGMMETRKETIYEEDDRTDSNIGGATNIHEKFKNAIENDPKKKQILRRYGYCRRANFHLSLVYWIYCKIPSLGLLAWDSIKTHASYGIDEWIHEEKSS